MADPAPPDPTPSTPPAPTPPGAQTRPASFGRRLVAWIVDGLIVAVPVWVVTGILAAVLPRGEPHLCTVAGEPGVCEDLTGVSILVIVAWWLAAAVIIVGWWHGVLVGRRGVTPGRQVVGIRVVDAVTGQPIGTARAIGRAFAAIVSAAPLGLGYLWMIWDPGSQTWHDKMVGSTVVRDPTL